MRDGPRMPCDVPSPGAENGRGPRGLVHAMYNYNCE